MSSDSPDRSSDMPDNPLVSALSSNLNAAWMASPSMVNSRLGTPYVFTRRLATMPFTPSCQLSPDTTSARWPW